MDKTIITGKIYLLVPLILCLLITKGYAENIDPDDDNSQYAWGENVGWINFEPSQGPGVTVTDTSMTGYAWGENIGWINLSPENGGIVNNGTGILTGYAWGENVGWINFSPVGGGVTIDSSTGEFSGTAWGENTGWINFTLEQGISVRTSWPEIIDNCPANPEKTEPGICGCEVADIDTDGDDTPDCVDQCPGDPLKTEPGTCGCGNTDSDADGDGFFACLNDCDDFNSAVNPGATEICDGLDNNCNNVVDETGDLLSEFSQPINSDGSSIFKAGRTIPIKISITDCTGKTVSSANPRLSIVKITDAVLGTFEEIVFDDSGDSNSSDNYFRYDAATGLYIYNLSTKRMSTGTYQINVATANGQTTEGLFSLK